MRKKAGAAICAALLLLGGISGYVAETPRESLPKDLWELKSVVAPETPRYSCGDTIVSMARKEYEYYRDNALTGGDRYWDMVSEALGWSMPGQPWCCCFVLCCAWQCGYIAPGGCFGDFSENGGNWIFWCGGLYDYLVNTTGLAQGYNFSCDYKPQPGDLILFAPTVGSDNPDHIGIVEYVDEEGRVCTIEGNAHNAVREILYGAYEIGSFAYNYRGARIVISGYIHPIYPAPEATEPTTEPITAPTTEPTTEPTDEPTQPPAPADKPGVPATMPHTPAETSEPTQPASEPTRPPETGPALPAEPAVPEVPSEPGRPIAPFVPTDPDPPVQPVIPTQPALPMAGISGGTRIWCC